jgi:hypothetical protein
VQRKSVGNLGKEIKAAGRDGPNGFTNVVVGWLSAVLVILNVGMRFPSASPFCATVRAYQPYGVTKVNIWQ